MGELESRAGVSVLDESEIMPRLHDPAEADAARCMKIASGFFELCLDPDIAYFDRALPDSSQLSLEASACCETVSPILRNDDNAFVSEPCLSWLKIGTFEADICIDASLERYLPGTDFVEIYTLDRFTPISYDDRTKATISFDYFPSEIICKIFSLFSFRDLCRYVSPVCTSWLAFSRDPSLRQRLLHADLGDMSSESLVKVITSRCSQLVVLELHGRTDLVMDDFMAIFDSCSSLRELSLAFCAQVTNEILEIVGRCCKSLQTLNLEGTMVTDDFIYRLIGLSVTKLNASHCRGITDHGALMYAQCFRYVSSVDFDGIQWLTNAFVHKLAACHRKTLAEVSLDGKNLTDEAVRLLAGCTSLRALSFSFCSSMTDDALRSVETCKRLMHLKLRKGVNFSSSALLSVLRELRWEKMNGGGLRLLSLAECTEVSDKCLVLVSQGCPNLEDLDLSWCLSVTDGGIARIVNSCSKMRKLALCGVRELSDWPFKHLPSCMPLLAFLDLRQCNKIEDAVVKEHVRCMTNLVVLNYYGGQVKYASTR